jgi:hypothetical protein
VNDADPRPVEERPETLLPETVLVRGFSDERGAGIDEEANDPKKVSAVRRFMGSPGAGVNSSSAWTRPSLISSRTIAGHGIARAIACATVLVTGS